MKKLLILLMAVITVSATRSQTKIAEVAKFKAETIDLGKVKQNEPAIASFEITNIGNKPLVIEQANPSCGCTIADYTKEPIATGKTGMVKATYNAASPGIFHKTVTVQFKDTDGTTTLTFTGEVVQ